MAKVKNKPTARKTKNNTTLKNNEPMVFGKNNYMLLIASTIVVIIGFLLMNGTNGDVVDVKSTQLTVAPVVVMLGFALAIYSIVAKPSENHSETAEENNKS